MTTQRQFVYASCVGLVVSVTCNGVAQIPHCESAMWLMLPGIFIAAPFVPHHPHSYNPYLYVLLAGFIDSLLYGLVALLILRHRSTWFIARIFVFMGLFALAALTDCHSASPTTNTVMLHDSTAAYPPRPTIAPPAFRVFHRNASTFTLVTESNADDDQIVALIYQLRDAAHAHSFDALHIDQKAVDARAPIAFFHIYRGVKCAPEKYADGTPPCGASYHAAGDYTFGGFANHNRDDGILLHHVNDQDQETEL